MLCYILNALRSMGSFSDNELAPSKYKFHTVFVENVYPILQFVVNSKTEIDKHPDYTESITSLVLKDIHEQGWGWRQPEMFVYRL